MAVSGIRIGIDIMGGDHYPHAPVEGVVSWSADHSHDAEVILIGDQAVIETELSRYSLPDHFRYQIRHTADKVTMNDPSKAVIAKTESSMFVGLQLVKSGDIDVFVSAGHSGAMLTGSVLILGTIAGVDRPTVTAVFPSKGKNITILSDVGANTECKPEHFVQFARLCNVFLKDTLGIEAPRVALLNVGEEKKKGLLLHQTAYQMMEETPDLNFIGNMQGWDIIAGNADIYICDGFTGNILLKYGESMYNYFKPKLPHDPDIERFNYENVGGLPFLGVNGNVILGHGISGPLAFKNMLLQAERVVRSGLVRKIAETFRSN